MPYFIFITFTFLLFVTNTPSYACGPDTNCELGGERYYRIRMPEGHDGKTPVGAIVYAHGFRGSAEGTMKNDALGKAISDLGLALIAVKSAGHDWHIPNAPKQHPPEELVELAYFDDVLADVARRFPVDMSKLMMTGFSAGGMMTWTLACERGEKFIGFAPMSGTFWAPHPQACPSPPANIIHYHGSSDKVVPLEGRRIGYAVQGNLFAVLNTYEKNGRYEGDVKEVAGGLSCLRKINPDARILEMCVFNGGHDFKTDYIVRAWNKITRLSAQNARAH